jgi:beta-galactosidase/beta-glucuronidase
MKRRSNNHRAKRPRTDVSFAYPRPQLQRDEWTELDGSWDFAIDVEGEITDPSAVKFDRHIILPFSPETPASGVHETGFYNAVWYRREFDVPKVARDQRLILHFGAVDYLATVWVNGHLAVQHEGGYTPFCADVTDLLHEDGRQTITVRAEDDPQDLSKPRGKQDWQLNAHSIWYWRTTGIWQPVWFEHVPRTHIIKIEWTPNVERWEIALRVRIANAIAQENLRLRVRLSANDRTLSDDSFSVTRGEVVRTIALPDPGIDDYRNEMLWAPHSPRLIDATLELLDESGQSIDAVKSYTAMRSIALLGNRFVLNGKPYALNLVLDQGYWPDGGLTAPGDDALRRDVELVKSMGFNGVRKHQKIENPRFLYWADKLGLFVWEEMPSCYRFSSQAIERLTKQWIEAIDRDISHPCIIAWVPFNESWGVPDLPVSIAQRHALQAIYHLTRTLDGTRPVISNDGWEATTTDIIGIHDYDADPARIARRYGIRDEELSNLFKNERPGHKILLLDGFNYQGQPIMLTEFGGIAYSKDYHGTWGYSRARTAEDFEHRYAQLLSAVRSTSQLAGFCYTQFTDTYQEANGLLFMDRTRKIPLDHIACATRGARSDDDHKIEAKWRKRLMSDQKHQDARARQT